MKKLSLQLYIRKIFSSKKIFLNKIKNYFWLKKIKKQINYLSFGSIKIIDYGINGEFVNYLIKKNQFFWL